MAGAALLAGDQPRLDALSQALGDDIRPVSAALGEITESGLDALPEPDVAVIWLDRNGSQRSARRLRARFDRLPIVFVAEAGEGASLSADISIDPRIGQPLEVVACESLERVPAVVGDLVRSARERRTARLAADAANARLVPGAGRAWPHRFANAVVDRVPLGIVLLDGDGEVRFANAWAMNALGGDDGPGAGAGPLLMPEAAEFLRRWSRHPDADAIDGSSEVRLASRDGVARHYLVGRVDADNASGSRLVMIQDVTERVEADAEHRRLERSEMVTSVCAGVNHHMNNTLAVIMGHAELLGDKLPREHAGHLSAIIESVEHSARITHGLLAYIGEHGEPTQAVDCARLVRDTVAAFGAGSGLAIALAVAGSGLMVDVVPQLLRLSLVNLLQNAVEACESQGVKEGSIHVSLGHDPADPDRVVIAVTDHGSGFTPEAAERAFDPFFTTKGLATHMGLGLSTVMGLVRQTGGRVEIDSAPGRGATVRLELPAASARGSAT